MYKVKLSLSESTFDNIFLIVAVTPDLEPVILKPINWSEYNDTGIPKNASSIWIHVKLLS